jgi:two-component system NtrC family sensor kinase
MSCSKTFPQIHGNTGRLQQVFPEPIPERQRCHDGWRDAAGVDNERDEGVSVAVSDTGGGITQEHIRRIYDPFFTTKTVATEGQSRGTGLGLSVTYGIIQEHAGKIRVDSRPGEGTTFYLDFPLSKEGGQCLKQP